MQNVKSPLTLGCASNLWVKVALPFFWVDNLNVVDHSEWSVMEPTLESLESRRKELHRSLEALGDFRRGTISVNFRKCGKSNCACAQEHHSGHGPQYLWNASVGGKTKARNLPLGPELEKVEKEVERYREFDRLCQELVMVNEQICQLRPARILADEDELEQLKKKLRRRFAARRKRKSTA